MINEIIQVQYDQLEQIAARFGRQAEAAAQMQGHVQQSLRALQAGGWEGRRAAAMLVDASLELIPIVTEVGGSIVGTRLGAYGGAFVMGLEGSVIPGAGTVAGIAAGTIIGGAAGGVVGDKIGALTGETLAYYVTNHWRDDMIVFVDEQIAQPVVSTMNKIIRSKDDVLTRLYQP